MTIEQGTKEWHEDRRAHIGGSDAAAALGLSKWKTPYQLYLEKLGESAPEDDNWNMARGRALEPLLRQHYADKTGRDVALPLSKMVSDKHPFMAYNPDGLIMGESRLVEFKTAAYGMGWGEQGSDEIPAEYIIQVQHGLIVTGFDVCDVTVSIAANEPKYFIVEADRELQELIIESEARFWELVKNQTPPPPKTNQDVFQRYSKAVGQSVVITPEIAADLITLRTVRDSIKEKEAQKEEIEVRIKAFMGENDSLVDEAHNLLATWKQRKGAERIDSKRLKLEQPDIAAQYTNSGEPTRTFLLK